MNEAKMNCMFQNWYSNFQQITFKSEIIPLPLEFIQYLHQDSIYMPESAFPKYQKDASNDYDEDESKWDDDEPDTEANGRFPNFPELEQRIKEVIQNFDGLVFPKLNWSCPKDATFMSVSGNIQCQNSNDIILLLKSSDFINHDLSQFELDGNNNECPYVLVLRKWYTLQPSMEFRCFVRSNTLCGMCQRDYTNFYPFLIDMKSEIQSKIQQFFDRHLKNQFASETYVFDVYLSGRRVWLVDFNPWDNTTDALLFDWDENLLNDPNPSSATDFRIVENQAQIRASLGMSMGLPADLRNFSSGSSLHQLVDQMKELEHEDQLIPEK